MRGDQSGEIAVALYLCLFHERRSECRDRRCTVFINVPIVVLYSLYRMRNTCSCCSKAISLPQVEDVSHLHEVISFIETRLHLVLSDKPQESTSAAEITPISDRVNYFINYGLYFLENVAKRVKRHACKIVMLNRDSRKVVIDILKGAEQIQWVGAGLGVVAKLLREMDNPSTTRNECVELLRFMSGLVKLFKQQDNHLPQEKLEDVVVFIIKGSFFCVSRMQNTNVCSIFRALVDDNEISSLQSKLCDKYPDLNLQAHATETLDPDEDIKHDAFNFPEKDILSSLDELMDYIEKCLAKPSATESEEITSGVDATVSGRVASLIEGGRHLLEKVVTHALKSGQTRKVVIDVLKELSQIHWLAAGLSIVAFVLEKIDDASTNKQECVNFLRYMYGLAKQLKKLKGHIPLDTLYDVAEFIFEGSFFCVSRIKSTDLSRFFSSEVDVEKIKSLQSKLGFKYHDLTLEAVTEVLNQMPAMLPPSQSQYPEAVGIDKARDDVIDLLDLNDQSAKSVVLYGVGGVGKTVLATAVFSSLPLDDYKYCRVDIQEDCKEPDLKHLQEQVLNDLFSQKIQLRSWKEGKEVLSKWFSYSDSRSRPLFLFIDNALRGSDLAKLLPQDLSCLPNRSRILITTRRLNETDMIEQGGFKRDGYRVNGLSKEDSKKLLCRKALDCSDNFFDTSLYNHSDRLVEICGGIPLVLVMVSSILRQLGNDFRACESAIEFLNDTLAKGEGELSEKVVGVVYEALRENLHKEAFLDIAVFFNDWDQRTVGYVVGELALKAVQEAALVKISEARVILHDIVQARGRKLSEKDRITDPESLESVLQNTQGLEKLKGVYLRWKSSNEPIFQLGAEHLDKTHKCLRVLCLGEGTKVTGACTRRFENLRYLQVDNGDCSPMELNKLPRLAIFEGRLRSDDKFCDLPRSLRRLRVEDLVSRGLAESFGELSRLEQLDLSQDKRRMMREGQEWRPTDYMTELPKNFGQLKSLRSLNLYSFIELTSLPDSFGQLSNLEKLKIQNCPKLSSLSKSFGQLSKLKELIISGCTNLHTLSDDFESLTCVVAIVASGCPVLSGKAVDQMIKLESLMLLNIKESPLLIHRWKEIEEGQPLLVWTGTSRDIMFRHSLRSESTFVKVDGLRREWSSTFLRGEEKIDFQVTCCELRSPWNKESFEMVDKETYCIFEHSMSRALFHVESRFVNIDGVKHQHSNEDLAFLVTCCDLCSLSNEVCEMLKKKLAELSCEGFHVMYVGLMEQSEENIGKILGHLSQGIGCGASLCAWIPPTPRNKWKQLFAFSAYMKTLVEGMHTFIARAHISASDQGNSQMQDFKRMFPEGGHVDEEGAMMDSGGGFSGLYSPLVDFFKGFLGLSSFRIFFGLSSQRQGL